MLAHHVNQAIRAHGCMHRDVDYVVNENGVIIVDSFTGRLMPGRRYSDGLHQAIEAKEGVQIQKENKTLATITFQNYFRMYGKLSGMTGTALTEEDEFREIYKLDVIEIPTNKPMIRDDHPDAVYRSLKGKYNAIVEQVKECHAKGQPVLVGTISIDKSEELSRMLPAYGAERKVPCQRGCNRCAGGSIRRSDDFHQHGRARYRYSAGRQPGVYGKRGDARKGHSRGIYRTLHRHDRHR